MLLVRRVAAATGFVAILLQVMAIGRVNAQDAGGSGSRAVARTVRVPSALAGERIVAVLLPTGYDQSDRRYPVVYLFHGGGQDHTAFLARTAFVPMARRHDVIVVMPAADRNYSGAASIVQERFHDFVASELTAYVDSRYRTIASRDGRAIAGISMGGRLAVMTALRHPQQFATVGAFSAALRTIGEEQASTESSPYFYVSCGTADTLLAASRQFSQWLDDRKIAHDYQEIPGKGHAWDLWDDEIAVFFDLVSKRMRPSRS